MSRNDLMVTAVGWAATKPKEVTGGVPFTSFRLASTPRFFDTRQGAWVDGRTEWVTVKVFRDIALNVAASIGKGDPVLVHGRLCTEEWQSESGLRTAMVIEATALGHDLTRGRGVFVRTVRGARAEGADAEGTDADGAPGADRTPVAVADDPWALPGDGADAHAQGSSDGTADVAEVVAVRTP